MIKAKRKKEAINLSKKIVKIGSNVPFGAINRLSLATIDITENVVQKTGEC